MPEKDPLQVLILEDSENDAALLEIELERAGYAPVCTRVQTADAVYAALDRQKWDLIIADYVMPQFDGLAALALVRERGLDIPFIIVSGHITDATAVAAMRAGAHDYVMKDKLARLGPAVRRELREAEVRLERRRSEEQLELEHTFREAIENSIPCGITTVDLEGHQTYVNPAFCAMVGWSEGDLLGARPPFLYWPAEEVEGITEAMARVVRGESPDTGIELRFCRRNGERFAVLLQATPLQDKYDNITGWVSSVSDISERKLAEIRLAGEHAITRILASASSLLEAAPGIIQVLLDALEVEVGAFWVVDPKGELLFPLLMNLRTRTPGLERFVHEGSRLGFPADASLPGRVWKSRKPAWVTDLSDDEHFKRRELAAQAGLRSGLGFPVQSGGEFFGVLEFFSTRRLAQHQKLVDMITAIGSEIGQFIRHRGAEEDLRSAHEELEMRVQQRTADLKSANAKLQDAIVVRKRLEQELLDITENERRRIGLDLHDDLGQKLSGLALMAKGLQLKLARANSDAAGDAQKIHALVQQAMDHTHDLAHDLATLDPKESNLVSALHHLASHAKELFDISCDFKAKGHIPALEPTVVSQLYKIAQEAVTNAIKHGKAKRVGISLSNGGENVVLKIKNNGVPFPDLKSRSTGMGLRIMNYRASLIGGSLEIKGANTQGTCVTCSVPVEVRSK